MFKSLNNPKWLYSLDYTVLQTRTDGDLTPEQSFLLHFFDIHLKSAARDCLYLRSPSFTHHARLMTISEGWTIN